MWQEGICVSSRPRIFRRKWGFSILSCPSAGWLQMVEPQDKNSLSLNDHKEGKLLTNQEHLYQTVSWVRNKILLFGRLYYCPQLSAAEPLQGPLVVSLPGGKVWFLHINAGLGHRTCLHWLVGYEQSGIDHIGAEESRAVAWLHHYTFFFVLRTASFREKLFR